MRLSGQRLNDRLQIFEAIHVDAAESKCRIDHRKFPRRYDDFDANEKCTQSVDPHRLQASLRERLKRIEPDVVVFGHTHEPYCETIGGILFRNPGSVTRPRGGHRSSLIRMTLDKVKITPKFIEF